MNNQARDQQLLQIATDVWAVKAALQAAFEAGQQLHLNNQETI